MNLHEYQAKELFRQFGVAVPRGIKATSPKEAVAAAKKYGVGKAEEVGPMMLRVKKGMTTEADAELLDALLKSFSEVSGKSLLFKSMGSDAAVDGDPEALLKAKADEIKKANTGLTDAQAYEKALENNPALYNAYIAKRRAA